VTAGAEGAAPGGGARGLPPLAWARLCLRAAAVAAATAVLFAVFLLARGADLAARAVWRAPLPALAPWVVHAWGRPAEARRQRDVLFHRLIRGDRMVIFPEGTSTDGLRVLRFKSTLFEVFFAPELAGRVWVQPVSLVYHAPPGLPAGFYGWFGDMDFVPSARDVLALSRGGRVEVVFHEPLRVAAHPDRKALAAQAEAAVRRGLEARLAGGAGARADASR
jgi:1-acyl-sn-glycerol-3-phosphate acyltransferase